MQYPSAESVGMTMIPAQGACWSSDADDRLLCIQVREETHDVKTFVFAGISADGERRRFDYLPGQFGIFEFDINGVRLNRCYTWSSSPTRPDTVSITVKKVPGGIVSNWLHESLRPGMIVSALGPSGVFSCFQQPAAQYLFVSGGSGITPLMSMARALHDLASTVDVVFLHCARTPDDVVFAEELALMARNMPNFRQVIVCDRRGAQAAWPGVLGHLDVGRLKALVPDFAQRVVYNCGPAPFMQAVREMLALNGYDLSHYHEESFSFENLTAAEPELAVAADTGSSDQFTISLSMQGKVFACGSEQTLLQAATEAGLRWPHSCANGVCGTCKVKKTAGDVNMAHNGGIRAREIKEGWILPCCSRPVSDVVLER